MAELIAQTKAYAKGDPLEVAAFKHQIALNIIPHIDASWTTGTRRKR